MHAVDRTGAAAAQAEAPSALRASTASAYDGNPILRAPGIQHPKPGSKLCDEDAARPWRCQATFVGKSSRRGSSPFVNAGKFLWVTPAYRTAPKIGAGRERHFHRVGRRRARRVLGAATRQAS